MVQGVGVVIMNRQLWWVVRACLLREMGFDDAQSVELFRYRAGLASRSDAREPRVMSLSDDSTCGSFAELATFTETCAAASPCATHQGERAAKRSRTM